MIASGSRIRLHCTWVFPLFPFLSMHTAHLKEEEKELLIKAGSAKLQLVLSFTRSGARMMVLLLW